MYVNSTVDLSLQYKRDTKFLLHGFTDADFDGDLDDQISILGYVFSYSSAGVSWCSKKQDSTSFSTTEEYKVSSFATQECVQFR